MIPPILLDTNVILDFFMERGEHYATARETMEKIEEGRLNAHVSASQITDVYYVLEKELSHEEALRIIIEVINSVRVISVDETTIRRATTLPMADFEDAVQTVAALDFGINIVVTRDKKGFLGSGLQVYSPEDFLELFESKP